MGEVVSIISGKGGTGKTTVCAALATCLVADGKRVLCIDADIGLRNLDIALGMTNQDVTVFTDVLRGLKTVADAAVHPVMPELRLLSAPLLENDELVDSIGFGILIKQARREFDFVLIDSPAGIGKGFRLSTQYADRALVVATPDPASLRDANRSAELLMLDGLEEMHLVVNRVVPKLFDRTNWTIDYMMDETGLRLLGVIPEDPHVLMSAISGIPLIYSTGKGAAEACLRISRRLAGDYMPLMKL